MAAFGHRCGRAAKHFVHKPSRRYLPRSRDQRADGTPRLPTVSTRFLSAHICHVAVRGAENAADEVTVGPAPSRCVGVGPTTLPSSGDDARRDAEDRGRRLVWHTCVLSRPAGVGSGAACPRSSASFRRTRPPATRRSLWERGQAAGVRAYSGNGGHPEPLYRTKTGYYDVLDVASAATQAQIKTAYYKQSFIYHPDRNAGSAVATARFSEISEAYSVLGNKALRKRYDLGLLTQSDLLSTSRPTGKESTGPSGKRSQRSVMSANDPGSVYNFDKFFKEHYQGQLQRDMDARARKVEMRQKSNQNTRELRLGLLTEMGIGMIFMTAAVLLLLKAK